MQSQTFKRDFYYNITYIFTGFSNLIHSISKLKEANESDISAPLFTCMTAVLI